MDAARCRPAPAHCPSAQLVQARVVPRPLATLVLTAAGALIGCRPAGPSRTIDLAPRTGWHAGPGTHVRPDGRISLLRDGTGFVWKQVELDVDEFPVLLFRIADSFSRFRWRLAALAGDSGEASPAAALPLIERVAEESHYIVPLRQPTGWTGRRRFRLLIVLDGYRRDWLELGDLAAVHLTDAAPPAPALVAPEDGAVLSAQALHFSLAQAPNAVAYELQIARRRDFAAAWSAPMTPPYLADRLPYLPDDGAPRDPGPWLWRARAVSMSGRAGPWSRPRGYTLERPAAPRPPVLVPSATEPLFVLMADRRTMVARWAALPAAVRRHAVLRVEDLPTESLAVTVQLAQRHGIPVLVQTSGPHDYYGPVSARIPLSDIDAWFRRYPVVKGAYICEQAFRVTPEGKRTMLAYARRLLALAAEHGRLVVWADAHWTRNLWIDAALDRPLAEAMRRYRPYFVPVIKMNGALTPHSALDATMGLWVAGFATAWGVQPERWYWYEAGLGPPGQQRWHKEGIMADFPPTFYGQLALLGLANGASVYSFEPGDDQWTADGELTPTASGVVMPLLEDLAEGRWIPGRTEALGGVRAVYVADSADSPWALDYGTLRPLYAAAYGESHPFAIIPSISRYGRIPIVPRSTPPEILASFRSRLRALVPATAAESRRLLDGLYPARAFGDAWIARLPHGVAVMNSHENQDIEQRFAVDLAGPVQHVSGRLGLNSYLIVRQDSGAVRLHVNARAGHVVSLELRVRGIPHRVETAPDGAIRQCAWDAARHRLSLRLVPNETAVTVAMRFPVALTSTSGLPPRLPPEEPPRGVCPASRTR